MCVCVCDGDNHLTHPHPYTPTPPPPLPTHLPHPLRLAACPLRWGTSPLHPLRTTAGKVCVRWRTLSLVVSDAPSEGGGVGRVEVGKGNECREGGRGWRGREPFACGWRVELAGGFGKGRDAQREVCSTLERGRERASLHPLCRCCLCTRLLRELRGGGHHDASQRLSVTSTGIRQL